MRVKERTGRAKALAVASSGGHWTQLLRIMPALESCEVVFVTVLQSYRTEVPRNRFYCVTDANRWNKLRLIMLAFQIARILVKERPDVIVSTGAAPGFFAVWFGRLFGAKTIWLDSVTNIERLSMSGTLAGLHADLWLTQWPHLAQPDGPHYAGAVL
jgi:UDP-N-acetylglucosamine:LPS N-acetylglucosamine transferase